MPTTYTRIILTDDDILTWAKEKGLVPMDGAYKVYGTNGEPANARVDDMALLDSDSDAGGGCNLIVITNETD